MTEWITMQTTTGWFVKVKLEPSAIQYAIRCLQVLKQQLKDRTPVVEPAPASEGQ